MGKTKSFSTLIILSALVSFFVGIRFADVGADTEAYINHFYKSSVAEWFYNRFEVGFSLMMQFFSKNTLSFELFFFFVAFLITTIYLYLFVRIYSKCFFDKAAYFDGVFVFFSLLLISSWYFTSITNGLRQGLALVFLYAALFELFFNRKKSKFIFLYLISISFHYSSLIMAPFLFVYYLPFRLVFMVWVLLGLGYFAGINELAVKLFSEAFSLPIYDFVKYFSLEKGYEHQGGGLYEGFILKFFIYTVFWPVVLLVIAETKLPFKSSSVNIEGVYALLKIYFLLSMIYFIFGFGPFSNRFALFAWFFVPVLQFCVIKFFDFRGAFYFLPVLVFLASLMFFLFFKLDWIRVLYI